ncbi:response regulator transcription factor [filamentous cyanobacterium LEGE 11480]|uniref:Response regulator transcription factor n=1 Tax=Romeriopsis navalis LEGE 11480 TaxID=2777977 RepID=A0A928Z5N9_9CYAN|nr:response regulator transcription factor [Romeriopsis navalis]MBE9031475.1 response regulator transcription factor [Romeriopsis navalis LEGE 11480]
MNTSLTIKSSCPISTLLIDDCHEFRQGLRDLLNFYNLTSDLQFQVVGQAASLTAAVQCAIDQTPQLILLDMELSDGTGIDVLQRLKQEHKLSHVLVISGHDEDELIFRTMQAGAQGYIFKHCLSTQLLEAIQLVLQEKVYLSPEVATRFFNYFHFSSGKPTRCHSTIHLTERERDVVYWLVQGASNEVISKELYITVGTVKAYLTTIFEKLNVSSRTQAALQALKLGLVSV